MSNYLDFWFVDKRNRKKTLLMYLIIFIIFYAFVSIMTYMFVHGAYEPITNYAIVQPKDIEPKDIEIVIEDARATNVNGYIKAKANNNTGNYVKEAYLKIDFLSERKVNMGTKYVDLSGLIEDETAKFEVKFKFENVNMFIITPVSKDEIKDIDKSEIIKIK